MEVELLTTLTLFKHIAWVFI